MPLSNKNSAIKTFMVLVVVGIFLSACASAGNVVPGLAPEVQEPPPAATTSQPPRANEVLQKQALAGTAPDFKLSTLDGEEITLSALRGHPVVINFWATWCPPCRFEMPAMERVYRRSREDGLVILAVNFQENKEEVSAFVNEFGLTFPILLDEKGNVAMQYRVRGLPTTYFVDGAGKVRKVRVGAMTEEFLETTVQELLQ